MKNSNKAIPAEGPGRQVLHISSITPDMKIDETNIPLTGLHAKGFRTQQGSNLFQLSRASFGQSELARGGRHQTSGSMHSSISGVTQSGGRFPKLRKSSMNDSKAANQLQQSKFEFQSFAQNQVPSSDVVSACYSGFPGFQPKKTVQMPFPVNADLHVMDF